VKEYKDNSESFVLITTIPENEKNNKEILEELKKTFDGIHYFSEKTRTY
jgi:hypothetical protein